MAITLNRNALKRYIGRRNLTQNAFAKELGLSGAYVAQLLGGQRKPSPSLRARLMEMTGLDFDTLFQFTEREEEIHA